MTLSTLRTLALALGVIALAGCNKAPQQKLSEVKVPAGFTFATSHGVDINLSAAASALPASGKGGLELARADGKLLYRGQLNAARPVHLKLAVPLKDAELIATLEGPNGAKSTVHLPIAGAAAQHQFQ
jgi:hypothetical protein